MYKKNKLNCLCSRAHGSETQEKQLSGTTLSHTIASLKCGTTHNFFITATNIIGMCGSINSELSSQDNFKLCSFYPESFK